MRKIEACFIVFFEDPFWVGVYERVENDLLEVCKITFGSEPKDYEIYKYLLQNWNRLQFSPPVEANKKSISKNNPKRMQRAIGKQLNAQGIATKSQQALKLQQEEGKTARKKKSRLQKEAEIQLKFELRQKKKKEKHRGH
ncbi:MAG: YjdF family protein [Clostridiales bacterium]|nr:YjdF family protein [Clostridiales bacterium]